ncbi:acyl carrier protein [Guyparkeria sp.]|uniref:acyl carrier protein n=1 Tax=Guyparkeria sp. TaxID=2035736 RepID=UPI003567890A
MQALELIRRGIAANTDIDPGLVSIDSRLDEIGIDSFTLLELIFTLEEEMNIELGDDAGTPETVRDLVDILEPYLTETQGG